MAEKRLSIGLFLNDKQFQSNLRKASNSLKKFGKNVTQAGKSLTTGLTLPIVALGAASVSAFDKQSKAIAQVEAGIKSTGNAAGFTAEELMKMASDLQSKTIFGDEEILQGVTAQLLTFTNIAGEQFDRTQTAALNLATRLDGDLKSASIQLGKALNDPVANLSALSRSGIQFSASQKETIKSLVETNRLADAQTIILDELENQYGGAAEAAASAGLGPFQQLKNVLGDVSEEFGKLILEGLVPFKDTLMGVAEALRSLSPETKSLIGRIGAIVAIAGPLLLIIGQMLTVFSQVATAIRTTAAAFKFLTAAMAANPFVLLGIAIASVIAAIIFFSTSSSNVAINVRNAFRKMANGVVSALNLMIEGINFFRDEQNQIKPIEPFKLEEPLKETANAADEAAKAVKNLNVETSKIKPIGGGSSGSSGGSGERTPAREITLMPKIEPTAIEPIKETANVIKESLTEATSAGKDLSNQFEETSNVAGNSFRQMADNSEASLEEMGASAANAAREIIKIEAAKAVAGFAASIFASVPFPVNLMLAAAAGSIAGSLFAKIIPPFAEGGLVSGATLGIVGEGRGTSMVNPEVIAPLDKLQGMLNQGGSTEVFGRISGADILLSSDRARGNRQRTRGK